jgi:hypothetical protein
MPFVGELIVFHVIGSEDTRNVSSRLVEYKPWPRLHKQN